MILFNNKVWIHLYEFKVLTEEYLCIRHHRDAITCVAQIAVPAVSRLVRVGDSPYHGKGHSTADTPFTSRLGNTNDSFCPKLITILTYDCLDDCLEDCLEDCLDERIKSRCFERDFFSSIFVYL